MANNIDYGKFIITYDPEKPQAHKDKYALSEVPLTAAEALPSPVPWPAGSVPTAAPLATAPAPTDDLSRFAGYDAVVVTWTSAEAATLASLFSPGYPVSAWYEYKHNAAAYIPLVTGANAPFNDSSAEMARYYHSMGLYFPCTIGKAKVLLFKSGLHLDYDGPATPVKKLMAEICAAVKPKIFITTGTGGAIGADVSLGDVIIASHVRFDCVQQFKDTAFATSEFATTALPANVLTAITPALTRVNGTRVAAGGGRAAPKFFSDASAIIVTTDFFAFDDSKDTYKLQGLGRACDMGDAMVAMALQGVAGLKFFAIRNASDPQIPNPNNDIAAAGKQSAEIYAKYGGLTTAASVIATWAVIHTIVG